MANEMEERSDESLELLETMMTSALYQSMSRSRICSETPSEFINHTHLCTELAL